MPFEGCGSPLCETSLLREILDLLGMLGTRTPLILLVNTIIAFFNSKYVVHQFYNQ